MEFPIDIRKDTNGNWFYTKNDIRRYLPFDNSLTFSPVLPVKLWQKYNYCNVNLSMILPNNKELFYNGQFLPIEAVKLTYPENTEFIWKTYKNKKGHEFPTSFSKWELYGLNHYTKDNEPRAKPEYPDYYGQIFYEMDEHFIMDENMDLHRISDFIPQSFLTVKHWSYYSEYCAENKIQLFAELNEYFQFNFLEREINHKGNNFADSFGDNYADN